MKEQIAVSVIVPIYNSEKYLLRAMHAVMGQSFKNIEIICVDDASTDNSLALLQELQKDDNRIKLIHHDVNKGAAVSRNDGLELARGKYVIFLDSDDYFYESMLEETYEKAATYDADVVMFGSEQVMVFEECVPKEPQVTVRVQYEHSVIDNVKEKRNLLCKVRHVPWDKLVKKSFLDAHQIRFPELLANEDVFYSYATVLLAERIVTCDKIFVKYYCGRVGSLTDFCAKKENYMIEAYRALWLFAKENKIEETLIIALFNGLLDSLQQYFSNQDNLLQIRENTLQKLKYYSDFLEDLKEYADKERFYPHNNVFIQKICRDENICAIAYEQYLEDGVKNVLLPLIQQEKKVAVWGCGERGKQLLHLLEKCNLKIDYVIDGAKKQQGKVYGSYRIVSYEAVEDKVDVILITNMLFLDEIKAKAAGKQIIYVWQ